MARICEEHRLGGMKCDGDECVGCALDSLIKERDRYSAALEKIRELIEGALAGKDSVR